MPVYNRYILHIILFAFAFAFTVIYLRIYVYIIIMSGKPSRRNFLRNDKRRRAWGKRDVKKKNLVRRIRK